MKWIRNGLVYMCSLGLSFVLYQSIIRHLFFIQYYFTVYHKLAIILLISIALYEFFIWFIYGFKTLTIKQIRRLLILQLLFIFVVSIKPVDIRSFSFDVTAIEFGIERDYLDIGNLLMYVPVGILLMYVWKNPLKVVSATLVGIFILESMQWITKFGIFDANDIFLNIAGVVLGVIVYYVSRLFITVDDSYKQKN